MFVYNTKSDDISEGVVSRVLTIETSDYGDIVIHINRFKSWDDEKFIQRNIKEIFENGFCDYEIDPTSGKTICRTYPPRQIKRVSYTRS